MKFNYQMLDGSGSGEMSDLERMSWEQEVDRVAYKIACDMLKHGIQSITITEVKK